MRVAAALDGAHLPGGVKIKKGKMRGEVSCGMLCSGPELDVPAGLYPHIGDEGIIEIFEDVPAGHGCARKYSAWAMSVIDFEILANRPDCLSVWGLARESAAVLNAALRHARNRRRGKGQRARLTDYAQGRNVRDTRDLPALLRARDSRMSRSARRPNGCANTFTARACARSTTSWISRTS